MARFRPADTSELAWEVARAAHERLGPEGRLRAAFEASEFSREEMRDALAARSMFNVIDSQSGWKADVIFVRDRESDRIEFGRRRAARLFGLDVYVISPEGSAANPDAV